MYFLFTDETNQQPTEKAQFFIYGGVFISAEQLPRVHRLVEEIRARHGFQAGDPFKFASHDRPAHVTPEVVKKAKRELLEGCCDIGITFSACLVLHDIAATREIHELVGWGANTMMGVFNRFLTEQGDHGVCVVDRLPFKAGFSYLRDRFQVGLEFPWGKTRRLERIIMFSSSCEGAGHAMSAIDIILGAFRYCVNERDKTEAPAKMIPLLVRMMWSRKFKGRRLLRGRGLVFRPQNIKHPPYKEQYDKLAEHLQGIIDGGKKKKPRMKLPKPPKWLRRPAAPAPPAPAPPAPARPAPPPPAPRRP